jgi:hypothetical protein
MLSVALMLSVVNAECHMLALDAEYRYAEYRYDECRYAECRGAVFTTLYFPRNLRKSPISWSVCSWQAFPVLSLFFVRSLPGVEQLKGSSLG